jgi:hypothetical protein
LDSYYLEQMEELRKLGNMCFHIYSQGNVADFEAVYSSPDTHLHINEDMCSTFIALAGADVLLTSRSSFSYVAAMLQTGEVIYADFWHRPCARWKIKKAPQGKIPYGTAPEVSKM